MTDGDALRAAIRANPEDDTPRLVYADWLDENGQEARAEFIRVQCAIALRRQPGNEHNCFHPDSAAERQKLNVGFPACRCPDCLLMHRQRTLLAAHETAWRRAGPCPACGGDGRRPSGEEPDPDATALPTEPCLACRGSGGRGGLLRRFDYHDNVTPLGYSSTPQFESVRVEWRCGFPGVVTVPRLADCVATVCRTCKRDRSGDTICTRCNSPAHPTPTPWLAALVNHHPVEQVVPLDREPYHVLEAPSHWAHFFNGSDFYRWWCYRPLGSHPPEHERAIVPERIYEMVKGEHSTRKEAVAALGRAVVKWARGAA